MTFLSAHIPLVFGAIGSIITLISMSAITVTGYQYLRAMEASQARIRAEKDGPRHAITRH